MRNKRMAYFEVSTELFASFLPDGMTMSELFDRLEKGSLGTDALHRVLEQKMLFPKEIRINGVSPHVGFARDTIAVRMEGEPFREVEEWCSSPICQPVYSRGESGNGIFIGFDNSHDAIDPEWYWRNVTVWKANPLPVQPRYDCISPLYTTVTLVDNCLAPPSGSGAPTNYETGCISGSDPLVTTTPYEIIPSEIRAPRTPRTKEITENPFYKEK